MIRKACFLLIALVLLLYPVPTQAAGLEQWGQALLALLQERPQSGMAGKVVVLDPGHGGSDAGALGPRNNKEKEVTLAVAKELRTLLQKEGAIVLLTRTVDKDVAWPGASDQEELQARADIANQAQGDIFISIHADAYNGYASGTTTYFLEGGSDRLARLVQQGLVEQLKLPNRGAQPNDYYLLEHTQMPAILTEVAFISNPKEEQLLTNRGFIRKAALGIYSGIRRYFSQKA